MVAERLSQAEIDDALTDCEASNAHTQCDGNCCYKRDVLADHVLELEADLRSAGYALAFLIFILALWIGAWRMGNLWTCGG